MQIPASESLFFFLSLTEGANSGWIWRSGQNRMLVTEWSWLVGAVPSILVLSGEAMVLQGSGVIPCHACACSELW